MVGDDSAYAGDEEEAEKDPESLDGLLSSVAKENEDVLRGMSEAQILEEQRQIREDLGLSDAVLKMLAARGGKRSGEQRPATEAGTASTPHARPAPAGAPLPQAAGLSQKQLDLEAEEEGTPEYIRRHFFPNEPQNPSLDWMRDGASPAGRAGGDASSSSTQLHSFDIKGATLPDSSAFEAPHVHSGGCSDLHNSSSSHFTIPSLISLTSSSVSAQRTTAFTILHRILSHPSHHSRNLGEKEWNSFRLQLATRAGYAFRDLNRGVVSAAIDVLEELFTRETQNPTEQKPLLDNEEVPASILSNFLDTAPFPPVAALLSPGALPRAAVLQLLSLVTSLVDLSHSPSSSDTLDLLFSTPKLLESLVSRLVATPWPTPSGSSSSSDDDLPTSQAIDLLTLLTSSSRSRAKLIIERKFFEAPLRFVAIPPWELSTEAEKAQGFELLSSALAFWTALGRYGLGTALRTQAGPVLDGLSERVTELAREGGKAEQWVAQYLDLLSVWTTAAIDPHVTGHDITWSQVDGWRDLGGEVTEWALSKEEKEEGATELLAAAVGLLASWLEGSKVNRSWRGEVERKWVGEGAVGKAFSEGGEAGRRVKDALERIAETGGRNGEAGLVAAALRLSNAYEEATEPPTGQLFALDVELVKHVFASLLLPPSSPAKNALALLLLPRLELSDRLPLTIDLLPLLGAQDAVAVRDHIDWILRIATSPSNANLASLSALHPSLEHPSLACLSILRPFFLHTIVTSSGGRVVGPLYPSSRDIKLTACLPPFAFTAPILSPTWPLVALNELLRSATSPVFEQLPAGTEVSELQLVRSSLALMHLVAVGGSGEISAPALVYDLIKVFMLEKDNGDTKGSSGAVGEVFRDEAVQQSLSSLLAILSIDQQWKPQLLLPDCRPNVATVEGVSSLVSSAPFYQLYTDFLGLYDSISLGDRLFGLLLLPPLSMAYPVDYRRLLWTDYSNLLRTLRFSVAEVISDKQGDGAWSSYLEPREENEMVLGAYVEALVAGSVTAETTPFLHLVAVHHVAAAFFAEAADEPLSRIAEKLVQSLVLRKAGGVLRLVLEYGQRKEGEEMRLPPHCFSVTEPVQRGARVERLRKYAGQGLEEKLDDLVCM